MKNMNNAGVFHSSGPDFRIAQARRGSGGHAGLLVAPNRSGGGAVKVFFVPGESPRKALSELLPMTLDTAILLEPPVTRLTRGNYSRRLYLFNSFTLELHFPLRYRILHIIRGRRYP